ncbi:unnamed protein product [Peronospora effusa]|nr:unnamed protein product [Peronospora effusa]
MSFNAAHFIAFKGLREKLHGHNYRLAVIVTGRVGSDGDVLKISIDDSNVHGVTEDLARFSFPKGGCSLLPIAHTSSEELVIYISDRLSDAFTRNALLMRGVQKMKISSSEADQHLASLERIIAPKS